MANNTKSINERMNAFEAQLSKNSSDIADIKAMLQAFINGGATKPATSPVKEDVKNVEASDKKPENKKQDGSDKKSERKKEAKLLKQWLYFEAHSKGNVKDGGKKLMPGYKTLVSSDRKGLEEGAGTWNVRTACITMGFKWEKNKHFYYMPEADWNALMVRVEKLRKNAALKKQIKDLKAQMA